nr:helix-turn-helix domain-containing protein [Vulgatibacter incomptus]
MWARSKASRLTIDDHLELHRRFRNGDSLAVAAAAVGCSAKSVHRLLRKTGGVAPRAPTRSEARLSVVEREEVSRGIQAGESFRKIATKIGRAPSTVSREVRAAGGREAYRAHLAEKGARQRARRPKPFKLVENAGLRQAVEEGLRQRWSPQQIAARLKVDHPKAPSFACHTRPSTAPFSCRPAGLSGRNSPPAFGRDEPGGTRASAPISGARSATW